MFPELTSSSIVPKTPRMGPKSAKFGPKPTEIDLIENNDYKKKNFKSELTSSSIGPKSARSVPKSAQIYPKSGNSFLKLDIKTPQSSIVKTDRGSKTVQITQIDSKSGNSGLKHTKIEDLKTPQSPIVKTDSGSKTVQITFKCQKCGINFGLWKDLKIYLKKEAESGIKKCDHLITHEMKPNNEVKQNHENKQNHDIKQNHEIRQNHKTEDKKPLQGKWVVPLERIETYKDGRNPGF